MKLVFRIPLWLLGALPGQVTYLTSRSADPLRDITNKTRINAVIQNGRYLSRVDLDKILAGVEAAASKTGKKLTGMEGMEGIDQKQ